MSNRQQKTEERYNNAIRDVINLIDKNRLTTPEEVKEYVRKNWLLDIEITDVLERSEYNICDRCNHFCWTEDMCWTEYLEEGDPVSEEIWKGIQAEGCEAIYCGICPECVMELRKRKESVSL